MKKFCLMLAVFTFVSVMPSFAVKMIVNNDTNRKVPSRSSVSNSEVYVEQGEDAFSPSFEQNRYYSNRAVNQQLERFIVFYKPILGQDIRPELIGTTWHYPSEIQHYNQQQQQHEAVSEHFNGDSVFYNKHYIREAADYYVVDTINRPGEVVPVGYEEL